MKRAVAFSFCAIVLMFLIPFPADAQLQRQTPPPLPGAVQPRVPPDLPKLSPPSLQFAPPLIYGDCSTGTVTLSARTTADTAVAVSTASPLVSVGYPVTQSATIRIPAGQQSATFRVCTVQFPAAQTAIPVSAQVGVLTGTGTLSVVPVQVKSISLAVRQVAGGNTIAGTLTLNGPFGSLEFFSLQQRAIKFTPSDPAIVRVVTADPQKAANVTVDPKGYSQGLAPAPGIITVPFTVQTQPVTSQKLVSIVAQYGGSQVKTDVTVYPKK